MPAPFQSANFMIKPVRSDFNPRTHTGCDLYAINLWESVGFTSIHSPTWGETS